MESIDTMAEQLKLLGDRTRLTMLALLQQREWCVCEFVDVFDISQPGVSQHIRKMRTGGLVREERRGQWVYYSLNIADKPHIQALLQALPNPSELLRAMGKTELEAVCGPNSGSCC